MQKVLATSFLRMLTSMTLSSYIGVLVQFLRFRAATHISKMNFAEDNLRIKFLSLNVDFSSLSRNFLRLRRPAYAVVK